MYRAKPIDTALTYIHENLTADISLEALSSYIHFSPYHFHRMFLLCTGETPMNYVKRQRLRLARLDLLDEKNSICDIAAKYMFDSQDGFSRAFRKCYGLTPGAYRKLNVKKDCHINSQTEGAKNMVLDSHLYERFACTYDEKKEAFGTLDKILELSQKTFHHGILSLESEINSLEPIFFKKAVQMLIDGFEPQYVKEILLNYILCGNYNGKDLLIRVIIMEGILSIQEGVNTTVIRERLSSFFGEDFISEIDKHFCVDNDSKSKMIDTYIEKNINKLANSKETSLLEEPLKRLDDRSLQRLLRDIDETTLVMALSGSSGYINSKVIKNVSRNIAVILIEGLENDTYSISEIIDSQKRIIETINSLIKQGDIVC